tara:strand:+ start:267 stop:719 length:453 start_codon:yes stop_codon:yes gene_type:complete
VTQELVVTSRKINQMKNLIAVLFSLVALGCADSHQETFDPTGYYVGTWSSDDSSVEDITVVVDRGLDEVITLRNYDNQCFFVHQLVESTEEFLRYELIPGECRASRGGETAVVHLLEGFMVITRDTVYSEATVQREEGDIVNLFFSGDRP